MKRIVSGLLLALVIVLSSGQSASAHVFFTGGNSSLSSGVIMHVTPDDDPIAGSEARFYIDIQNQTITSEAYTFKLSITNSKGVTDQAVTYPAGRTSVTAKYIFPVQGAYSIRLRATPIANTPGGNETPVEFTYTQQVSRGITASVLDQPRYVWAEFGLILLLFAFVVLLLIIVSRRERIIGYTKW